MVQTNDQTTHSIDIVIVRAGPDADHKLEHLTVRVQVHRRLIHIAQVVISDAKDTPSDELEIGQTRRPDLGAGARRVCAFPGKMAGFGTR